jgi:predicted CXXCH cytochrome family protein
MIRCLIVQVARGHHGLVTRKESRVSGEVLEVGRSGTCLIHLPDSRVKLRHAAIRRIADNGLEIAGEPDAIVIVNGHVASVARLVPGTSYDIGPYFFKVIEPDHGIDLALEIESRLELSESGIAPTASISRKPFRVGKRAVGFALACVILLGFFIFPLLSRTSASFEDWQASLPAPPTRMLSPGKLSSGHALFADRCSTCHDRVFHAVSDSACSRCHERTGIHLASEHSDAALLGEQRCVDCHAAHEGRALANADDSKICVSCHARANSKVAGASDFGLAHPEFRLTFGQGKDAVRVRQGSGERPADTSNLKFPHDIHLVKKGVSSPEGDTVLRCRDCHRSELGRDGFEPISMKASCQQSRCHAQQLSEPVFGMVPHGAEFLPLQKARAYFLKDLAGFPGELTRQCGPTPKGLTDLAHALACAERLAKDFTQRTVFHADGENRLCALCHQIQQTGKPESPWRVVPVRINRDWFPMASFPHARHATTPCEDCHQKASSKSAEDVSIPDLKNCRQCHTGIAGPTNMIRSGCRSCHLHHRKVALQTE